MQKFAQEEQKQSAFGSMHLQNENVILLSLDDLLFLNKYSTQNQFQSLSALAGVSSQNTYSENERFVSQFSYSREYKQESGENAHLITDQYITFYPKAVTLPSSVIGPRKYISKASDKKVISSSVSEFLESIKAQFGGIKEGMSFAVRVPIEQPTTKGLNTQIKEAYEQEVRDQLMLKFGITKNVYIEAKAFYISYAEFAKNLNEKYDKFGSKRKTSDSWQNLRDDLITYGRTASNQKLDENFAAQLNKATTFEEFQNTLSKREGNIHFAYGHHNISSINEQMQKYRTGKASDICQLKILESGEVVYSSKINASFLPALYERANGTPAALILPDGREMQCHFRYDKTGRRKEPYLVDAFDKIVNTNTLLEGAPVGSTLTIKGEDGAVLLKRIKVGETIQIVEQEKVGGILPITSPVSAYKVVDYSYEIMQQFLKDAISSIEGTDAKFTKGKITQAELLRNEKSNHEQYITNFVQRCESWLEGEGQKPPELDYKSIIFISDAAATDTSEVISRGAGEDLREILFRLKNEKGLAINVEFLMVAPARFTHPSDLVGGTLYGKDQFMALAKNVAGAEVEEDGLSNANPLDIKSASKGQISVTWLVSPDIAYVREKGRPGSFGGKFMQTEKSLLDKERYKQPLNDKFKEVYYSALERSIRQ